MTGQGRAVSLGVTMNFRMMRAERPTAHSVEQPGLLDERNLHDCFPFLLLPIQVRIELRWIEVDNRRIRVKHEVLQMGESGN